jgi:dUTP pyrophosphatase
MPLQVQIVDPRATPPKKAHAGDAGYDLLCLDPVSVSPGERLGVDIGMNFAIPVGYYGKIESRSGNAKRLGVICIAGVLDSGYRGPVSVLLYNTTDVVVLFRAETAIAQLVIVKIEEDDEVEVVPALSETSRGANGWGSTDAKRKVPKATEQPPKRVKRSVSDGLAEKKRKEIDRNEVSDR